MLMRPGFGTGSFDLLVLGRHDRPSAAPNVFPILGACHRLSPSRLAEARHAWRELGLLPSPRVAVLVGGPVRGEGMREDEARTLIRCVQDRFATGAFLVTTSRRTGVRAAAAIAEALAATPHRLFRWGDAGRNPYVGFLAWGGGDRRHRQFRLHARRGLRDRRPRVRSRARRSGRHARLDREP
ncbi:MAG: ELM1/GtrOC1 family putative glycosyltransferase [Acetobacteraceae bacterium]|nr:ELM1/GtrOC1 family putative glycosyltransferase [Acetobacteraceae bacterium]